jgi:hypothetical protein
MENKPEPHRCPGCDRVIGEAEAWIGLRGVGGACLRCVKPDATFMKWRLERMQHGYDEWKRDRARALENRKYTTTTSSGASLASTEEELL